MDPRQNPYAPGAGTPPPELAGRDDLIERAAVALDRIRGGRAARSFILYGLRGVGKTVLLNRIRLDAEARGIVSVRMEAPEERSLPALLAPALRAALMRLSRGEALKDNAQRAMRALASFVGALRVNYQDLEVRIDRRGPRSTPRSRAPGWPTAATLLDTDLDPEIGLADSSDLDTDLTDLLTTLGNAAHERETALVFFIDELQYVPEDQLASLIAALHSTSQEQLPITMVAAGLPQLVGRTGNAKSYAERLFEFAPVGRLDENDARDALIVPASKEGVEFHPEAVAEVLRETNGYPYFLQEWGKHSWNTADHSPIMLSDAQRATREALAELDASFFRVRLDRLTPTQKRYLRAMAELGPGPHRSGDIAQTLGVRVTTVAPVRNLLIAKGMIYSPAHGDTAFTVPLFDGFMRRIMPDIS